MLLKNWENLPHEAKELILHGDNHYDLDSRKKDIIKALRKKILKGNYEKEKAKDLWKYFADSSARNYTIMHNPNSKWHEMFPNNIRKKVADHYEDKHRDELKENINLINNIIENAAEKKPLEIKEIFNNLIHKKIVEIINDKKEKIKKDVFNSNKSTNDDNCVHASIRGD